MEAWQSEMYHRELYHHGILGMRWGKRNGPPYPLGVSDHSASEKKAGWRKSLDRGSSNSNRKKRDVEANAKTGFHLTDSQKTAIKVGTVAAVAVLATYGAYKMGYLDNAKVVGEKYAQKILGKIGSEPLPELGRVSTPKMDAKTGFKLTNESLSDSLKAANPFRGTAEGTNNRAASAIAGFLRTQGYDVSAKNVEGTKNLKEVLNNCFDIGYGHKVFEGTATKLAKSPEKVEQMLKLAFRDNASGVMGLHFKGEDDEQVFNWSIKDGVVRFLDFQQGADDASVRQLWSRIDPDGAVTLAKLSGLEINLDNISKYVGG